MDLVLYSGLLLIYSFFFFFFIYLLMAVLEGDSLI